MTKTYMNIDQLGAYLGISPKTLRNWKYLDPRKLPPHVAVTTGGKYDKWRWDSEMVDKWLHDQTARAPERV